MPPIDPFLTEITRLALAVWSVASLTACPTRRFASYGRTGAAVDELRQQFAAWPR
jgi:hypothetical protein